jgi:hypothetical protein
MSVIEIIPSTQILLRGQITDALTGVGITAALTMEFDQGAGFQPLPFALRQQAGGWFAVAARMGEIAARLRIGAAVTLRLSAVAAGYQTATVVRVLSAAEFARVARMITVKGVPVPTEQIAVAPVVINLNLSPKPVMLAGLVLSDNDPDTPVAGAQVQITGPGGASVTTDAAGRFRIDAPPLLLSLPLRVSKGARVALDTHVVSFDTPVNFITLNLPTP